MTINEILAATEHRPWAMPTGPWKYYQEWNKAIILHWPVDFKMLRKLVPQELIIDDYIGTYWVSLVAFTMQKIRPWYLPPFSPISDFDEINIRTYVKSGNKSGVYFLSIEAGNPISSYIAKQLSGLPYRCSKINREENLYTSSNKYFQDKLRLKYKATHELTGRTGLDFWLTERYALYQDINTSINEFEIHHVEWPLQNIELEELHLDYPRFSKLLLSQPSIMHYSNGVQVVAWDKRKLK
jgi:uncharacterized protein YqjF (DUF2071 family)